MGLDQWLRRIRRPTDDEMAAFRGVPVAEMGKCNILPLELDTKEQRETLKPVMPWLRTITRTSMEYDTERMLEAIGAPKNSRLVCWGSGVVWFVDRKGGRWLFSSDAPYAKNRMKKVRRKFGVCWHVGIKYWRKALDIHMAFIAALPYCMEICGYYPLQGEALDELMPLLEAEGLSRKDVEPTEDSVVCYDWCY